MLPGMLTPPTGLPDEMLVAVLGGRWGFEVASLEYAPLGFGSHHWRVSGVGGRRWFVTVDELRPRTLGEPSAAAFERLRAALATARELSAGGLDFVVAPIPDRDDEVVARIGEHYAVACYPLLAGRQFAWGEFRDDAHRRAAFDMIVAVHSAPVAAVARADDFTVAHRDEFDRALAGERVDRGPYGEPMAELIASAADEIRAAWRCYDDLAATARTADPVLTHGEPHAGNTMLTPEGWRLIDWDTALLAPPERDLWDLDPGDGSLLRDYTAVTGVTPRPDLLDLYRLRWDLTDAAEYVHRFRHPHTDSADAAESWKGLCENISRLTGAAPARATTS